MKLRKRARREGGAARQCVQTVVRVLLARIDVVRVLARARDGLALPLNRRLACFVIGV